MGSVHRQRLTGAAWLDDVSVRTFWDDAPDGSVAWRVEWIRPSHRERLRRWLGCRTALHEGAFALTSGPVELEPVSGSFAASLIERGGLVAPAELRGPDGDAFAYDYFLGDENALLIREENAATRDFKRFANPSHRRTVPTKSSLNSTDASRSGSWSAFVSGNSTNASRLAPERSAATGGRRGGRPDGGPLHLPQRRLRPAGGRMFETPGGAGA